jgi:hypothetical protein
MPDDLVEATVPYNYIDIKAENVDITTAKIHFKVKKSWIKDREIVLSRYTTKWVDLPTQAKRGDSEYTYFEATTPGFSYFAVRAIEVAEETEEPAITGDAAEPEPTKEPEPAEQLDIEEETFEPEVADSKFPFFAVMIVIAATMFIGFLLFAYVRSRY